MPHACHLALPCPALRCMHVLGGSQLRPPILVEVRGEGSATTGRANRPPDDRPSFLNGVEVACRRIPPVCTDLNVPCCMV